MAVAYELQYHPLVKKDVDRLSSADRERIEENIKQKLISQPEVFGIPLRSSLKSYRKLRVGDYRVVFRIEAKTVKIIAIQHRSVIYKYLEKRL